jgi:hypothetical protein
MPPALRRAAREKALLKAYVRYNKGRQRRIFLRRRAAARLRRQNHVESLRYACHAATDSLSSLSSGNILDTDSQDSSSSDDWADILGEDWRFASDLLDDESSIVITDFTSESSSKDDSMPDLQSIKTN